MRLLMCVFVLSLGGCLPFCAPGPNDPNETTCDSPDGAQLSELELVLPDGDGYVAIEADDIVPVTSGGQGSPMISVYLRMSGDVPACIEQRTELRDTDDRLVEYDELPRNMRAQADGTFVSDRILLILEEVSPERMRLLGLAGGLVVDQTIVLGASSRIDEPSRPLATSSW